MATNSTDRSLKTLVNRRVTDSTKQIYEEFGDSTINLHNSELWVDAVPTTPPGSSTAPVQLVGFSSLFALTWDDSVAGNQCWFATSNPSNPNDETSRLKDWISEKYNGSQYLPGQGYAIQLYDNSGTQISTVDSSQWFFDYQTGILTFSGTTLSNGTTLSSINPSTWQFKIKGYRYVGRKGLDGNIIKNPVRLATTSNPSWTYNSGTLVLDTGATATSLSLDGVALNTVAGSLGDRILVKDASTQSHNGIYYVSAVGDGSSQTWQFTRAADFSDSSHIFAGCKVFVQLGTLNAKTIWAMSNAAFVTMDASGVSGEVIFGQDSGGANAVGTTNTLAMFTDTNTLGDSIVQQQTYGANNLIYVAGDIQGRSKSFNIPHPLKPGKRLVYGSLEGPEHGVYHRGSVSGKGEVFVELPDYWSNLVKSYDVFVTSLNGAPLMIRGQNEKGFIVCRKWVARHLRMELRFAYCAIGSRSDVDLIIEQPEFQTHGNDRKKQP